MVNDLVAPLLSSADRPFLSGREMDSSRALDPANGLSQRNGSVGAVDVFENQDRMRLIQASLEQELDGLDDVQDGELPCGWLIASPFGASDRLIEEVVGVLP